jgi:hypothetical protein
MPSSIYATCAMVIMRYNCKPECANIAPFTISANGSLYTLPDTLAFLLDQFNRVWSESVCPNADSCQHLTLATQLNYIKHRTMTFSGGVYYSYRHAPACSCEPPPEGIGLRQTQALSASERVLQCDAQELGSMRCPIAKVLR